MSQSNKRSFEPRRSEYRPLNSSQQRPPQARPAQPRPQASQQRPPQRPPQQRPMPQARPVRPEAYRQQGRPAYVPAKERTGLPYGFGKILLACAALVAVCIALQFAFPNGIHIATHTGEETAARVSQIYSNGPVRINEIMTSNRRTLNLEDGSSPDWIEIINTGNHSVNLKDYSLSKSADSASVFTFPDMSLQPGESMLLYADSKLSETVEREMHVPFRLSSAGDTLMLFNAGRTAIDTVNIPAITGDHSYLRVDNSHWEVSDQPTPGAENTEASYIAMKQKAAYSPVVISEIVAVNDSAFAAQDGMYYDYIELRNVSSENVNLGGWYLSDDAEYTRKWRIPDTDIASGECILVFASGLDMREDLTQLHAAFSLNSEGETITLCDPNGAIMDQVTFNLMKSNTAYALQADGSWANTTATPGAAN